MQDVTFQGLLQSWWKDFVMDNAEHASNHCLFWEIAKAVLRGKILTCVTSHKRDTRERYWAVSKLARQTKLQYKAETQNPIELSGFKQNKIVII